MSRPTMKDVAEHAGVSRQLVSMVLRDLEGPKRETRERILDAARELGYHPDLSARLLSQRRSHQIGVVYTMHQPFEVDLVECLFLAAAKSGYRVVLAPLAPGRNQETAVSELMQQRIEALVVLAADGGRATLPELSLRLPTVQLNGPTASFPADDVRVDNREGMRLAVEHLVGLGHTRICHVDGGAGPNAEERRRGYIESMGACGLEHEVDLVGSAYTEEDGARAALSLLSRDVLPTAVVCCNDRCAFGLVETLAREWVSVPEDLSVVGYDDSSIASLSFLNLTTVRHDPTRLAELAIDALVRRLDDESRLPAMQNLVEAQLVVRSTTGPPPASR